MKGIIFEKRMSHSTTKILLPRQKSWQFPLRLAALHPRPMLGNSPGSTQITGAQPSVIQTRESRVKRPILFGRNGAGTEVWSSHSTPGPSAGPNSSWEIHPSFCQINKLSPAQQPLGLSCIRYPFSFIFGIYKNIPS